MAGIKEKKEKLMKSYNDFILKLEEEENNIKELEKRYTNLSDSINNLSVSMGTSIEHLNISLDEVKNIEKNYKESNELPQDNKDLDSDMKVLTNMDGDKGDNINNTDIEKSNKCDESVDECDSDSTEYFST